MKINPSALLALTIALFAAFACFALAAMRQGVGVTPLISVQIGDDRPYKERTVTRDGMIYKQMVGRSGRVFSEEMEGIQIAFPLPPAMPRRRH